LDCVEPNGLKRKISFALITARCHLGCEGTLEKATIYSQPRILATIISIIQPLQKYIQHISVIIGQVSVECLNGYGLKRF
jgi:hypothetical protein